MLKPHTQPHGVCTCRADERSLRERSPLQAPGQLGATELSKALVVNNALAKLDLAWNQIGDTGAAELSKALMVNTVLTKLPDVDREV